MSAGSSLGDALGDPNDPLQTAKGADAPNAGAFHFYEVSLLEASSTDCTFCLEPYLQDLQSDGFRLATLHFYAPSTSVSGSYTNITASDVMLSNANGNEISGVTVNNARVVIPEPSTVLLFLIGLGLLAITMQRRTFRKDRGSYLTTLSLSRDLGTPNQIRVNFLTISKNNFASIFDKLIALTKVVAISFLVSGLTYSATSGPIPDGSINLTITSTSLVTHNHYITQGNSGGTYLDSIIPMSVTDSDDFSWAQIAITYTQTVAITFTSDAPTGQHTNQNKSFTFTNGTYFISFQYYDAYGLDNDCNMSIQKYENGQFGPALLSVTQKCYSYSNAYFRSNGIDGILQTTAADESATTVKQFTIPNGNSTWGAELFSPYTAACSSPIQCGKMTRKINIGDYGGLTINTSDNGANSVIKGFDVSPYDHFVFTSNAHSLTVAHSRVNLPQALPTIDQIPNPAPITFGDGLRTVQLQGISNGNLDLTEGISVTVASSNPSIIPSPSIDYHSGDTTGTLSYQAVEGSIGSSTITVAVKADGGTPNYPADDRSTTTSFTVKVLAAKPCDGAGCFVYVGHRDHGLIEVIDAATNVIVDTIAVSNLGGNELAITPDGSRIYAIGYSGGPSHVSIVDTASNTETGTIPLLDDATAMAITPDGSRVYVTLPGWQPGVQVVLIDTATNTIAQTITISDEIFPDGLAFSPNGKLAYITTDSGNVVVLDTRSHAVIATIPVGTGQHHLAVTPDGGRVYVVSLDSDNVSVIDATTNQVIGTVAVGNRPEGIAITPDGRRAYVASFVNAFNGRLDVVDTTTNTVTKIISLNGINGPNEIGITPDGTRAYVTFHSDRAVSMIAIATNQAVETVPIGTPTIGTVISGIPLFARKLGDINRDGSINKNDLTILLSDLNKPVSNSVCGLSCDLDGDGKITVLDSRRLVTLCTKAGCSTQ